MSNFRIVYQKRSKLKKARLENTQRMGHKFTVSEITRKYDVTMVEGAVAPD
jgi:hypothetical protein